jgi:hypothetical protein
MFLFISTCWNVLVFTVTILSAIALDAALVLIVSQQSSLPGFTFSQSVFLAALSGLEVLSYP